MGYIHTIVIKVENSELQKTIKQLTAFQWRERLGVVKALKEGTAKTAKTARRKAPKLTGGLRRRIRFSFNEKTLVGLVKSNAPYSHLIENGVKASIVRPNPKSRKKALTIMGNGIKKIAREAHIPARRAHPFMKPAYDECYPDILADVRKAVYKL